LALAAISVHLGGCFFDRDSINEPLDPALVRSLRPGATTAKEVVEMFGAPSDVVQLGRRTAYRYDHTVGKTAAAWFILVAMASTDTRQDRLWVFFDENQVLSHYGSTLSSHRAQYSSPWEDLHEPEDDADADAGRPGLAPSPARR
jgi:hypothetical protein